MKKNLVLLFLMFSVPLFAYDWPIANFTDKSNISDNFGQNRGNVINNSIIFAEPEEIRATEDGYILYYNTEENDETDLFESTLGNSLIISHPDNLISVYGNLDKESLSNSIYCKNRLKKNDKISDTGSSGWHKENETLEFQIIDIQNSISINPKVLLPRTSKEKDLPTYSLMIENKNGDLHELRNVKTFQSGLYKIYQKRYTIPAPYKSSVSLNGIIVDEILYDTIKNENNRNFVSGKKKYTSTDIYKDDLQLLGEVMLTPGKSTISINIENFAGKNAAANYQVTIY